MRGPFGLRAVAKPDVASGKSTSHGELEDWPKDKMVARVNNSGWIAGVFALGVFT
jgi:hypothetical protein